MSKVCPCCVEFSGPIGDGKKLTKKLCKHCKKYNEQRQAELIEAKKESGDIRNDLQLWRQAAEDAAKEIKRLREALEQIIRTFQATQKYNNKGDALNMYEIASQALKGEQT